MSPTPIMNNAIKINDKFVKSSSTTTKSNDKFIAINNNEETTATNTLTVTVVTETNQRQRYSNTKKSKFIHHRHLQTNEADVNESLPQPYYTLDHPVEINNVYDDKCLLFTSIKNDIKCVIIRSTVPIVVDDDCDDVCREEITRVVVNGFRESLNDGSFFAALPRF